MKGRGQGVLCQEMLYILFQDILYSFMLIGLV
jgi:hypothetical protein